MNAHKKILMVSRGRPIDRGESLTRRALKEHETMKHIAQRLLLAVTLTVVVVVSGLLYPVSAGATDTLDQSQTVSQSSQTVHSDLQRAQIFTAGMYGFLDRVSLRLENYVPSPPAGAVLNVSIQTVINGVPSGEQIGSGTIAFSTIPAYGSGGDWVDVGITGANVHPDTQYALVLQTSPWNAVVTWWYAYKNAYGSTYTGGEMASNYGNGWSIDGSYDFTFQTYAVQTTRPGQKIIGAGNVHSLALKKDGTVWAWGGNGWGQLGNGAPFPILENPTTPVQVVGLTDVVDIAVGSGHNLALKSDGTVWAWGWNNYGQLGVGNTTNYSSPHKVHGQDNVGYLTDVVNVEAGDDFSFAVKSDGTVWAWGHNNVYQLGDVSGNPTDHKTPVPVQLFYNGTGVISGLAGGGKHSLAIKDGYVWSWGDNGSGQLGNYSTDGGMDGYVPFPIYTGSGLTGVVTAVDAGDKHSVALTNGTVWAWGENSQGQLGCNSNNDHNYPVQVHGTGNVGYLSGITEISAGWHHSLAVKEDGSLWSWGGGWYGQLGVNSNNDHYTPVQVHGPGNVGHLSGVTNVAGGDYHSLAVTSDGSVWAWGNNDNWQLGINNRDSHQVPYQVHGPGNVGFLTDIGAPAASNPPGEGTGKPEVTDMAPAPGATDVFRRTTVTATFSENMDTSTLTEKNFRLYEMNAKKGAIQITDVIVTPNPEGTEVTLDPYGASGKALSKDTEYLAVITTGVKDLDGNAMATHKFWRFVTGSQKGE